jgi:hypothetical protein
MGEWPPDNTATFLPAAIFTTACTSCADLGIAITLGHCFMAKFQQSSRAPRYAAGSASCGVKTGQGSLSSPVAFSAWSTAEGKSLLLASRGPYRGKKIGVSGEGAMEFVAVLTEWEEAE